MRASSHINPHHRNQNDLDSPTQTAPIASSERLRPEPPPLLGHIGIDGNRIDRRRGFRVDETC